MSTESKLMNKVRILLGLEVKLEKMELVNGAVLESETFEVGAEVFVIADDERVAVPVGTYEMKDGMTMVVAEEGIIESITEGNAEEEEAAPTEAESDVKEEEEELSSETAQPKKIVKSISEEMFFSEIDKLKEEIKELKLSSEKPKVETFVDLSAEEVEGISHNPENGSAKKELQLHSQKAKNTLQNRIFNTINK
tara:strand:+ start:1132 stop:1716 length:585 start_codon:yes stop_codon:yes gene_type:complete